MDPNANLEEQLELVARLLYEEAEDDIDEDYLQDRADMAIRLAELVEALNGWITRGGFLPRAWNNKGATR